MNRLSTNQQLLVITVVLFALIWSVLRFIVTPLILR
jgi:hypothetical protein